ncbi:MAG: glycosyl hydrolase family 18 protein [Candidatus Limnocylindrales bacterium]
MAARRVRQGVALLLLVLVAAGLPASAVSQSPSAAPAMSAAPGASPVPTPTPTPRPLVLPSLAPVAPLAAPGPALTREVMAYLPYWVAQHDELPWDPDLEPWITDGRLTDLVLFSVGIGRDGALRLDEPGARWILGPDAARVISAAHERGIRVLVSFTSFGRERNERLLSRDAAIERFARQAAQLVAARGFDGADLDVEQLPSDRFSGYGRMVRRLAESLRANDPDARVTVATNGNRSGARMASLAIRRGADRAFLMGYAYRGPGSPVTGNIAPLVKTDGGLGLRASLELYAERGVPFERIIVGLPAYGMTWATRGPELHARRAPPSVSERGSTTLFRVVGPRAGATDVTYDEDPVEGSARVAWFQPDRGTWFQTYYDTPATLRAKYLLAHEERLAGVGMWVLGYDLGDPGYPALVDELFARPVVDAVTAVPMADLAVRLHARVYPGLAATTGVRVSNDGTTWTDWLDPTAFDPTGEGQPWPLAEGPDGPRTIHVQAGDAAGTLSKPAVFEVRLDRVPPTLAGPSLRPGPVPGSWLVLAGGRDEGGSATTEVRWSVGDGVVRDWSPLDSLAAGSIQAPIDQPVTVEVRVTDLAGRVTSGSATAPAGSWSRP